MPISGGSLPTTRRHLPTQKGGIHPIIKPCNTSKYTTNPITISNTNNTTTNTVINYNPIIPSTAPNRRKLPTTKTAPASPAANYNNGVSGSGKLDCKKVLPSKSLNSAVTPITPITGYEQISIDYNNSGNPGGLDLPHRPEVFYNILWPVLVTGLFSLTYEWLMWHYNQNNSYR